MKVLFLVAGPDIVASSRTRVYQYIPYLKRAGIQCYAIAYESQSSCGAKLNLFHKNFLSKVISKLYNWLQILRFICRASRYDVLFIQRVLLPLSVQRLLKRINANIIFDFDDALYLNLKKRFIERFNNLLRESKCIIVENRFTGDYASRFNKNIFTITGPIEVNRYLPKMGNPVRDKIVIGWIGSPATAVFLKPLYEVFQWLIRKYENLWIELIGAPGLNLGVANAIIKNWRLETEVSDLQDFDIGIMPLPDDEWSKGKGGYKLLQYMAIGIPCVASPVGINREIIKDGVNGFLGGNQEEWMERLSRLIEDRELREKMGREGRNLAESLYSYEVNFPKFISILKEVASS